MLITHALIAKGSHVLCDYSPVNDSLLERSSKLLSRIPRGNGRRTYVFESKTFNYLLDDEFAFMCVGSSDAGAETPFKFLDDVSTQFSSSYKNSSSAESSSHKLTLLLKSLMDTYNGQQSQMTRVERELEYVTGSIKENICKVIERGEQIETLLGKTENLSDDSRSFRVASRGSKRRHWYQNVHTSVLLVFIFLGMVFVLASSVCGGVSLPTCRGARSGAAALRGAAPDED